MLTKTQACVGALMAAAIFDVSAQSLVMNPIWNLAPGARTYVTADNTQRGLAYNPATRHVLLVNRAGSLSVNVLDSATGADAGTLNVTGITGGTFALNMISVAADGAIYAANLTTDSTTSPFKVYRWANESAAPEVIYSGDPSSGDATATNRRFGDNLDVTGLGNQTQILAASRAGTVAAVFTTDGTTFAAKKINVTGAAAGDIGLGVAFGKDNTFWGTASGKNLKLISYDAAAGTATVLSDFGVAVLPTSIATIAYDSKNNLLAGLNLATPDTFQLFDLSTGTPVLWDTKLTAKGDPDNANANGTGAMDFGTGVLFALDSNNGITAFAIIPEPSTIALLGLGLFGFYFRRKALEK